MGKVGFRVRVRVRIRVRVRGRVRVIVRVKTRVLRYLIPFFLSDPLPKKAPSPFCRALQPRKAAACNTGSRGVWPSRPSASCP